MAIGVDTSKWKPRKITGTPAAKFRNRLAAGILGFGILWGAFFQLSSYTEPMKTAAEVLYEDPVQEVERKILIASGMHLRSGANLRRLMEEEERVDLPHNKYKVVSKYFSGKTAMDESLTEFKEKKSLKVAKKVPPVKPKVKKVKQVKGQKDIRAVLKGKKNELVAYSEDFDSICKKSGIDVDSEQLQLAIALSKSLQTESANGPSTSSKSLTTQQRTGLIRTTLKEYGFKVPEKPSANRKAKKRRKPYKLLLTSEDEKQQIITDRYTQVLFELNNLKNISCNKDLVLSNLFIYNMCTNVQYENIKDDGIFYVENIIEESPNNMGCLLKNWSDIPGRPSSPDRDKSELLFSEIECSQDELDIVLSGSLKCSKDVLQMKSLEGKEPNCHSVKRNINKTFKESSDLMEDCIENPTSPVFFAVNSDISNPGKHKKPLTVVIEREKDQLTVKQPHRSLSPDLFDDDDDDDTVIDIPNEAITKSGSNNELKLATNSNSTKEASEVMDLTECVNIYTQKNIDNSELVKPFSQLSQHTDITKRRSNDFMEMTECVASCSRQILERIDEQVDLTGNCENFATKSKTSVCDKNADIAECVDRSSQPILNKFDEHIDLTAFCEHDKETQVHQSCEDNVAMTKDVTGIFLEDKTANADEHIDLTGHSVSDIKLKNNNENNDNIEQMDLTQSSNSSYSSNDTLPFVYITGTQAPLEKSVDDTIVLNENDYLDKSLDITMKINNVDSQQQNQTVNSKNTTVCDETSIIHLDETSEVPKVDDDNLDVTHTSDSNEASCSPSNNYSHTVNKNNSTGDETVETDETPIVNLDETDEVLKVDDDNVDLTQTSHSSEALHRLSNNNNHNDNSRNSTDSDTVKTDETPIINLDEPGEVLKVDDDNVDLTQTYNSNEAPHSCSKNNSHHINNSSLGKKDDVSVDYDEALENMNSFPYYSHDDNYDNDTIDLDLQKINDKVLSDSRQEVMELSDNELTSPNKPKEGENHFDFGGISVIENLHSFNRKSRNTMSSLPDGSMSDSLPMVHVKGSANGIAKSAFTDVLDPILNPISNKINENPSNARPKTPKTKVNKELSVETPEHSEYIVKTDNVTPMVDYASMSTPERNRELDKYGLKPFKRKRAIQLLTHLYNQTHPYVEATEELTSPSKKRRTETFSQPSCSKTSSTTSISPQKRVRSPRKASQSPRKWSKSPSNGGGGGDVDLNDSDKENDLFSETSEVPLIRNVECDADDWVFQKREKAKLSSCRVPLHIAFHNFVSCRRRLQEAILRYEPVNIDVIHKQLAASGHRYDPKDLLKFLDKKCITVKTADTTKNNKRY